MDMIYIIIRFYYVRRNDTTNNYYISRHFRSGERWWILSN